MLGWHPINLNQIQAIEKLKSITSTYAEKAKEYFGGKTANRVECCNSSIAKAASKDKDYPRSYSMLANIGIRNYEEGSSWKGEFQELQKYRSVKFTFERLERMKKQRMKGMQRKKLPSIIQRRRTLKLFKKQRNSATPEQIQQGFTYKEASKSKKQKGCLCQERNGIRCQNRCGCALKMEKCGQFCKCKTKCNNLGKGKF